ncbi:MAG: oxaloacetate decarboxylase [Pseudomonadales bacterium]
MTSQLEKCLSFEALHGSAGAFVIPNPFDLGSARVLEHLGFKALATSSAGFAQTLGRGDGQVTLEEKLAHCGQLAAGTGIPVNVDFEDGFADDPATVAKHVLRLAETGVAGCSVEDFSRTGKTVFGFELAVERVQAAAEAVASLDVPFQLTARAEGLLRRSGDLDDVIGRLQAFEKAGAHVLYPPGLTSLDQIRRVRAEVNRPLNVLAPFLSKSNVAELADAGATRISVGSALASLAMGSVIDAGREMLESGTFHWSARMPQDLAALLGP